MRGATGDSPEKASARSFNSAKPHYSSIGCTSNSCTGVSRSCLKEDAASPRRPWVYSSFSLRCWRSRSDERDGRKGQLRFCGRIHRWLLRLWNPYDHFAGLGALEFFPRDPLDRSRIGLQRFNVIAELEVFGIQTIDILAHALDLILRSAHGDKSVRAENIVHHQCQHEQTQNGSSVQFQKFVEPVLRAFVHYASTHLVASPVNRAEAFGLPASTYKRSNRSVPESRSSIQLPSSKTNFAPSVRSTETTFRPRSVLASTATFLIAFAFCSSLSCRFSRTGQNSRPNFLKSALICSPSEPPRAASISATSRHARMPSFSGTWPRMVSPALSSPPSAILSSRISWPMYLNPTGVW